MIELYIEQNERYEAVEVYKDRLTEQQIEAIKDYAGRVKLIFDIQGAHVVLLP